MKALIQRVTRASVSVEGETIGEIKKGLLVLLGLTDTDTEKEVSYLALKIANLRVFPGDKSGFDISLLDIQGDLLVVSQFTLYGSTKKGRRPDFNAAARPEMAEPLYDLFIDKMRKTGLNVATGRFGADMDVELINDGPVTLMIESPAA